MKHRITAIIHSILFASATVLSAPAAELIEWGRNLPEDRDDRLMLTAGAITELKGMVQETTRKLYDVTGSYWKQEDAESYDTDDFNLDGPFPTFGISYERAAHLFSFQIDAAYVSAEATSVARRNYYLSVGSDISYNGQKYDHLKIPKGTEFTAELQGIFMEINVPFHPVSINPTDTLKIVPSFDMSVMLFGGQYSIDAGEPTGVMQYQNPPEDFVIGGKADGLAGIGMPQFGPGLEIAFGDPDAIAWNFQAHYLMFGYDGSTDWLTSADHREKNAEIDHTNIRLRGTMEIALENEKCLLLGAQYQIIETTGSITSTATDDAEILAKQERFDKEFTFDMTSVSGFIGLGF
jgi:hypothetical protein